MLPAPAPANATPAGVAPPSRGEIHITAPPAGTEGNPTIQPPKADSAKGKMFSKLRDKAGVPNPPSQPPKPGVPAPDPAARPGSDQQQAPPSEDDVDDGSTPPPTDPNADPKAGKTADEPPKIPVTPEDRRKVSPWKLVDQFKERAARAEARALELEKGVVPEAQRKEAEARITKYEQRIKEMEDDLRYHNAEKYDPDIIKAHNEYEGAWKRAVSELSEISVMDSATGQPRPVAATDILDLVNMPLGKAREIANAQFGDFADDVMAHRKEIKTLFENKMAKLDELKKNGSERDKQREEQQKRMSGEVATQVRTAWEGEISKVLASEKHGKFFKPREGDDDWNTKLEKGFKLVEDAYSVNAADPKLTPEERAAAVRKAVAVRNRAAGFEALRLDYDRLQLQFEEAKKRLAQYEESTPSIGGTTPPGAAPAATGGAFSRLQTKLRGLAK